MTDLCDFMLVWFLRMYEDAKTAGHPMSAEVYDRAVFVIGTAVPLMIFAFVLFCAALAALCVYKFIGGRRR